MYSLRALDYAFEHCPLLEKELTVYRGVTVKELSHFSTQFGTYVSVTTNLHVAKQFAPNECCIFKIRLPKGSRVLALRGISLFPEQEELLLPRGTIFKPMQTTEIIDCINVHDCEHIPPSSPKYDYEKLYNQILLSAGESSQIAMLDWTRIEATELYFSRMVDIENTEETE